MIVFVLLAMFQNPADVSGRVYAADLTSPLAGVVMTLRPTGMNENTFSATSDAEGRYEFHGVASGRYSVACSRSDFPATYAGAGATSFHPVNFWLREGQSLKNVDCQLNPGGEVSGVALDENGNPLAGEMVEITRKVGDGEGRFRFATVKGTRTDDHGNYRLVNLAPGIFYVRVVARRESLEQRIEVTPGHAQQDVDLKLRPTVRHSISGFVAGFAGGSVKATLTSGVDYKFSDTTAQIQPDGSFRLAGLVPGRYLLTAGEKESASKSVDLDSSDLADVTLRVSPGTTLRGRVVLNGKSLPADCTVKLYPFGENYAGPKSATVTIAPDFTFEIPHVQAGEYEAMIVSGPGVYAHRGIRRSGEATLKRTVEVSDGIGELAIEVHLPPPGFGAMIRGRVRNEAGDPASNVTVVAVTDDPNMRLTERYLYIARTEIDGTYSFPGVLPGGYVLVAWPSWETYPLYAPTIWPQLEKDALQLSVEPGARAVRDLTLSRATETLASRVF